MNKNIELYEKLLEELKEVAKLTSYEEVLGPTCIAGEAVFHVRSVRQGLAGCLVAAQVFEGLQPVEGLASQEERKADWCPHCEDEIS